MIHIDDTTYTIPKECFYKTKTKKTQIILGGSLRKDNLHIKRLQKKDYGMTKKWNTFSISREGKVFQHYDSNHYTDFMGNKKIDKKSISIILENMGGVYFDHEKNKWLNWALEECDESRVFEKNWKSCRYWEAYTQEQVRSTIELCKYLCEKHDIVLDSLGFNVHHDDTINFNGIVTRSNYDFDYNDLNPSFDFRLFLAELGVEYE